MYDYPNCGFPVRLLNGYSLRQEGDETYVSFEDLQGLHVAITHCLISQSRRLSMHRFRFLRKELGIGQRELAGLLDYTEGSVSHWERGVSGIPKLADVALREFAIDVFGSPGQRSLRSRLDIENVEGEDAVLIFQRNAAGWTETTSRFSVYISTAVLDWTNTPKLQEPTPLPGEHSGVSTQQKRSAELLLPA